MHVDDWIEQVKLDYKASRCSQEGNVTLSDVTNNIESKEKIRHQIKLYEKNCDDAIKQFYNDEVDKFELIRYFNIVCRDLYVKIHNLLVEEIERLKKEKEEREKNAVNTIQAMFKNKKKREIERLRRKEEKERLRRKEIKNKIWKEIEKEARLKQLGGLGALGFLGGGAYLGSKYLKKKRRKKVKKRRKKVKKRRKKVKKKKNSKK